MNAETRHQTIIAKMASLSIAEIAAEITRLDEIHIDLEMQHSEAIKQDNQSEVNRLEADIMEVNDLTDALKSMITFMEPQGQDCVTALIAIGSSFMALAMDCAESFQTAADRRAGERCFFAAMRYSKTDNTAFSGLCNLHRDHSKIIATS